MLGWFKHLGKDESFGLRIAVKLADLAQVESNALRRHFAYHALLEWYYRFRDTMPDALEKAMEMSRRQIATSSAAAAEFRRDQSFDALPVHGGYERLAIILERRGQFEDVIELSKKALEEGWTGGWANRIARNEKKLVKKRNSASSPT